MMRLLRMFPKRITAAALIIYLISAPIPLSTEAAEPEWQNTVYIQPEPIINVILPMNLNFTIDPFEVDGRGQIYSDTYIVSNYSPNAVVFDIVDMNVSFYNSWDYEQVPYPFDDGLESERKLIYLELGFEGNYIPPIVLTDSVYPNNASVSLEAPNGYNEEMSRVAFKFSGNVNANPAVGWNRGDVLVTMVYSITPVPVQNIPAEQPIPVLTPGATPYIPSEQQTPEAAPYIPPEQQMPEATPYIPPEQQMPEQTPYIPPEQQMPEQTPYIPPEQQMPEQTPYIQPEQPLPDPAQYTQPEQPWPTPTPTPTPHIPSEDSEGGASE